MFTIIPASRQRSHPRYFVSNQWKKDTRNEYCHQTSETESKTILFQDRAVCYKCIHCGKKRKKTAYPFPFFACLWGPVAPGYICFWCNGAPIPFSDVLSQFKTYYGSGILVHREWEGWNCFSMWSVLLQRGGIFGCVVNDIALGGILCEMNFGDEGPWLKNLCTTL